MSPRKKEIEIYTFDELSPKVKKRVLDKFRERGDLIESSEITEFFKQQLTDAGLPTSDIGWGLNYTQGDGVAFYGAFDLEDYLSKKSEAWLWHTWSPGKGVPAIYKSLFTTPPTVEITAEIRKVGPHMYDHWNTMEVDLEVRYWTDLPPTSALRKKVDTAIEEFKRMLKEDIVKMSRKLEGFGYTMIEDATSDERIEDIIEANEYEFTEDGDIV